LLPGQELCQWYPGVVEQGQDNLVIYDGSSIAIQRGHAPDQEGDLAEPVEGNPASDEVSEVFDNREGSEDHPVGEPLGVVRFALGLQSFDGAVGRVGKPNHVGKKLSSKSKSKPCSYQTNHSISNV